MQELFAMNQRLLGLLGVSHVTLDDLTSLAGQHGLQAKLTGAGGGGCAFILITPGTVCYTRSIFIAYIYKICTLTCTTYNLSKVPVL